MYPVFVPIAPTGPPTSGGVGGLLILLGGMCYMIYKQTKKTYQMKITQPNESTATVQVRSINYPNLVKITNHNLDCLQQKGYKLNTDNNPYVSYSWTPIVALNKRTPVSKYEFTEDCRKCNVSTEISYRYDSFLHNEVHKKIKIEWAKCVKDEIQ